MELDCPAEAVALSQHKKKCPQKDFPIFGLDAPRTDENQSRDSSVVLMKMHPASVSLAE